MLLAAGAVIIDRRSISRTPILRPSGLSPQSPSYWSPMAFTLLRSSYPFFLPDAFAYVKYLPFKLPVKSTARASRPAAVVRRPIWMEGNRRRNGRGLEQHSAKNVGQKLRHLRPGLRTGRRHRLPRPKIRPAALAQRRPHLFPVGPARLFRQLHDRARRHAASVWKNSAKTSNCRTFRRQSLRAGERSRRLHLPRPEVRHPGPTLATDKTLELT